MSKEGKKLLRRLIIPKEDVKDNVCLLFQNIFMSPALLYSSQKSCHIVPLAPLVAVTYSVLKLIFSNIQNGDFTNLRLPRFG